jgi:acid phosphatase
MEENQGFSQVFPSGLATNCSSSEMPYLCGLAAKNGIALNFYSNMHGSLLDYLFNTSGAGWTNSPFNCNGNHCSAPGAITGDNLVRALSASGLTWRGYFEDMPSQGYMGGNVAGYVDRHNPFKWYSDVAGSTAQKNNMYPFSQFASDVNANAFQTFSYIVPNIHHDAHGTGTESSKALLAAADVWLQTYIPPLLSTPPFQAGGDGVLFITFDESTLKGDSGDSIDDDSCSPTEATGCGGHVPFAIISPFVVPGSTADATYHFEDMLHTIIHLLGMSDYMNEPDGAADIGLL